MKYDRFNRLRLGCTHKDIVSGLRLIVASGI